MTAASEASSTEVQSHFAEYLDQAREAPVIVMRHKRRAAVLLSPDEYDRLCHAEEEMLLLRVRTAEAEGYLGPDASEAWLREMAGR